jgi:diaminopimelate epimerase
MPGLPIVKAHADGNDFLLAPLTGVVGDIPTLVRAICHRHHGIGADGLVLHEIREREATMRLWNADGSPSELSGNGLRCLAALVARADGMVPALDGSHVVSVETAAGVKTLGFLARSGERYSFRAAMGQPEQLRQVRIQVAGEELPAVLLSVGNPQCVVLGPLPDQRRFEALGPAIATHPMFEAGTNVEFAHVENPGRVRIRIWERGVGPTSSSGTGASASAVAAAAYGGAAHSVEVVAPGGSQRVEWLDEGIFLTGSAEIVLEGVWGGG